MVAFYAIPCRKTQETWECCFERCSTISSANRYITIKYWKSSNIFRHLLLFNAWTWTLQNLRYVISIAAFTGPQTKTRSSPERIGGLILKQIRKYPSWKWAVTLPSRYVVIRTYSCSVYLDWFGMIWVWFRFLDHHRPKFYPKFHLLPWRTVDADLKPRLNAAEAVGKAPTEMSSVCFT